MAVEQGCSSKILSESFASTPSDLTFLRLIMKSKYEALIAGLQLVRKLGARHIQVNGIIISDNEKQFADNPFKGWCENLGINQHFTSVGHPQANRQVENFNQTLLHGLKIRLHQVGSFWADKLPNVLWSYRTTPRSTTQEIPFFLTYRSEAVIPTEILTSSSWMAAYTAEANEEKRRVDLDLIEEKRDAAVAWVALYKNILVNYYNARVKHLNFGDLVLRKNLVSRAEPQDKLAPKWEGPY
nr:uncharacterized protein LOC113693285 [Coffea arabica]